MEVLEGGDDLRGAKLSARLVTCLDDRRLSSISGAITVIRRAAVADTLLAK
jgi:hypothetical protein